MQLWCLDCLRHAGATADQRSRLEIPIPGFTQKRLAYCDGPLHDRVIVVDPGGAFVCLPQDLPATTDTWTVPTAGHSLTPA